MKHLIITLALFFSLSAQAQQTSIVTGSGADTTSYSKTAKIRKYTKNDIDIIKEKSSEWNSAIFSANELLKSSKESLKKVLDMLKAKNDEFLQTENDPSVKTYSRKDVPTCAGEKNRLIYEGNVWKCVKPITCDEAAGGGQKEWIQDKTTGKCIKPAAQWEVGSWSSCNFSKNLQTRTVKCVIGSGNQKKYFNYKDACSKPEPIGSRECADLPKDY